MCVLERRLFVVYFFSDTGSPELYPLSLHDALPIWIRPSSIVSSARCGATSSSRGWTCRASASIHESSRSRSEEHTSELQSPYDLVCRLLLEKKKSKPSHS